MTTGARVIDLRGDDPTEALHERGLTDGLPVVVPTPERIDAFVELSGCPADEVVAIVPPMAGVATVATVAANAVMAGCRPEHAPVVLAGVRAICHEDFNLFGVRTSNHPASPLYIVAGPVVEDLGFNHSTNVFGPASRANATVGRALNLVIQNIGGATVPVVDQSVMGHPGRYTYCIAESPESPWEPLHVARGLGSGVSAVTAFAAEAPTSVPDYSSTEPEELARSFAFHVANSWRSPWYALSETIVVANPAHAKVLVKHGWGRAEILASIASQARELAGDLPAESDLTSFGRTFEDSLYLVCAGGPWGQYSSIVTGWVGPGPGSTMRSEEIRS